VVFARVDSGDSVVGALIMAGGVLRCMVAVDEGEAGEINTFSDFVVGAYLVIFGFFIIMIEFAVPLFVVMHLGFLHVRCCVGYWPNADE